MEARRAQRMPSPPVSSSTNGAQLPSMVATLEISGSRIGFSEIAVTIAPVPVLSEPMPGRQAPEPSRAAG